MRISATDDKAEIQEFVPIALKPTLLVAGMNAAIAVAPSFAGDDFRRPMAF